jgi:hypothetical protein
LFTSAVCDHCESPPKGRFFRGYVVYRADEASPFTEYLFKTGHDAVVWRSIRDIKQAEVRCVLSADPVAWQLGRGRAAGLTMTGRPFEIYADHRFPAGAERAFLAPAGVDPRADVTYLDVPAPARRTAIGLF